MRHYSLLRAIAQAGQSPCDKYACAARVQCAEKELACQAFEHFVESGRALHPRVDMSQLGHPDQWPMLDMITPTRSTFVAMSSDSQRLPETRDKLVAATLATGEQSQSALQLAWDQP